jgi:hypothetical protein
MVINLNLFFGKTRIACGQIKHQARHFFWKSMVSDNGEDQKRE